MRDWVIVILFSLIALLFCYVSIGQAAIAEDKDFFTDQKSGLIFNDYLIRLDNIARIVVMNSSTSNIVVIGKDNWLFTDVNESMADYRGLTHLSESQLAYTLEIVKSERDYLESKGIPLILVVAPNKESIYPEYMPEGIKKINNDTQLDQVLTYFKENSDIQIIDLRPVLIKAKSERQVYRKNDSHWNSYGSYLAYREIIGATGLTAHLLSDYNEVVQGGDITGDLSRALKLEDMYPESEVIMRYELKDVPSETLPSALIFHDSFYTSTNLQELMKPHFDKITEVRYGQLTLFSSELVERVKPSIVIYIMVERVLPRYFMPWR
jgi:alginate O-acetyltransferase complex protein AlgJ